MDRKNAKYQGLKNYWWLNLISRKLETRGLKLISRGLNLFSEFFWFFNVNLTVHGLNIISQKIIYSISRQENSQNFG